MFATHLPCCLVLCPSRLQYSLDSPLLSISWDLACLDELEPTQTLFVGFATQRPFATQCPPSCTQDQTGHLARRSRLLSRRIRPSSLLPHPNWPHTTHPTRHPSPVTPPISSRLIHPLLISTLLIHTLYFPVTCPLNFVPIAPAFPTSTASPHRLSPRVAANHTAARGSSPSRRQSRPHALAA